MGYFVKVEPNVKVYVEDLNPNSKDVIVFLHGWPGSHELFEYQFDKLPDLNYRCIGIDMRGFGKSDRPYTGYDYDTLSDDLKHVVDELKLKDFTLLGHSTGGAIAVRYMARHNGHGVARLVLCAAAVPSVIKRPNFPYGLPREVVLDLINGTYTDRPKMLKDFYNMFFFRYTTCAFSDWFFNLGIQAAGWATAEIAKTWLKEEQLFEDIKKINRKTLILHGIHDKVIPYDLGEFQHEEIKGSKFIPFKFSGHGLFYDEVGKFNKELMDFIQE